MIRRLAALFCIAITAGAAPRLQFDPSARRYALEGPVSLKHVRLGIELNGAMRWASDADRAAWKENEAAFQFGNIHWTVRFRHAGEAWLIDSTIRNTGDKPVKLGRCILADSGDISLGANPVALVMTEGQGATRVWRLAQSQKPLVGKILTQWYSTASQQALQFGFVSFDRAEVVVESGWDRARSMPTVSAWTDFQSFSLSPGASVDSETLRIGFEQDPFAALDRCADDVRDRSHPHIWPKIPAGWLGHSWVDSSHYEQYEGVVHRNIRAIRKRLPGHDIEYVWVSLGNIKDRLPGNWLAWNRDEFPGGPEALSQDLQSLKFRLGLWCGAFWMSAGLSSEVERLRGAFMLWQDKPLTIAHRDLGPMYVLDPTHPAAQSFLRDVFATYRRWGVRYYMVDFLDAITGASPGRHLNDGYYDRSRIPGPQAWREGLRAIRSAAGEDTYLLASTGPKIQLTGMMDGVRVGSDYGEGRSLYGPGKGFYPATFVINKPDFWTSHRAALEAMSSYFFTHRKLFLADSGNVLTVDKPVPLADAQISATIFGMNGGPVMLGDDIDRISEERLAIIRRVFPRLPECARPLDLFDTPEPDFPRVFHLPIQREWDRWDLLAVFNLGSGWIEKNIPLERLGLDRDAPYAVWDFWNERFQGVVHGSVSLSVGPESVRLLRIARDREHPWLLATDMHVRQGQAEISDCRWDQSTSTLTIRAQRPAGEQGSIFIRAPAGWALADPKGLWIAKDGRDGSLIVRSAVSFGAEPAEVRLRFQR